MTTTFEQAIADLKNVTMWNISEHGPIIVAGLNDLAKRLQALETHVVNLQDHLVDKALTDLENITSANLPNNTR